MQTPSKWGRQKYSGWECPPLRPMKKDIAGYDVIALGSPTWWYTMAPAMRTFVTTHEFTGKKMIFFTTHGGRPGSAIKHLKNLTHADEVLGTIEVRFDSNGGDEQINAGKGCGRLDFYDEEESARVEWMCHIKSSKR